MSPSVATLDEGGSAGAAGHVLAVAKVRDPERYLILGEHGRGGLGRVARAHDRELGRDVAIKEVLSRDPVTEVRFLREALITARLEHPGIVAVHEAGRWPDGTPFYAMKLVAGRSLQELIAERKTADERLGLLHHVIAVADAIAYAHGRHIVHRDLKPANVIVGDFGETIVIDWGLAKDLTAADEPPAGTSPFRANLDPGLTSAGAVLGTPAYMAPEQARGESVDQRADVFAIGAMLWELCALTRPNDEPNGRYRVLRRAGIDKDLATIIDKALDPDPARRYAHAGDLAADLKAFKSGARIGARSYSLLALLSHWVRRHRVLAVSVAAAVLVAAGGVAFHIRNIALERDRADAARLDAEAQRRIADTQRRSAQRDRSELVLQHAALLLHSDPTAAATVVASYDGDDEVRRHRLAAEALGRGVARVVAAPHTDTIWFLVGEPGGAIVTLGEDRKIRRTHEGVSTTLASDVATTVLVDYAAGPRLLAYATAPSGVSVLDLTTRASRRIPISGAIAGMAIAPDGTVVATLDSEGTLTLWSPAVGKLHELALPGAIDLRFATPTRLVVVERAALRTVTLSPGGLTASRPQPITARAIDARADGVIVGDQTGQITLLSASLEPIGTRAVCHRQVNTVRFAAKAGRAAYACQDGVGGVVQLAAPGEALAAVGEFQTSGGTIDAVPDPSGQWIAAFSESSLAYIYDVERRMLHAYEGQPARISTAVAPTAAFGSFAFGDVNGTLRVFAPPETGGRTVLQAPQAIFHVAFAADGGALVTDGADGTVRRVALGGGAVRELGAHQGIARNLQMATGGGAFVSVGTDRAVRAWRVRDGALLRTFTGHTAEVAEAGFLDEGQTAVSAGADGRVLAWPLEGTGETELYRQAVPLVALEVLRAQRRVAVADAAGAVWVVAAAGPPRSVRAADRATVTALRASPDGRWLAIGTNQGEVTVLDTDSWTAALSTSASGPIRRIAFDPRGRDLAIASEDGHLTIARLGNGRALPWSSIAASVRDVAYGPDGETLGFVCSDGSTWLYAVRDNVWVHALDHAADTITGAFSPDGRWFASCDGKGVVTLRDVVASFAKAPRSDRSTRRSHREEDDLEKAARPAP